MNQAEWLYRDARECLPLCNFIRPLDLLDSTDSLEISVLVNIPNMIGL